MSTIPISGAILLNSLIREENIRKGDRKIRAGDTLQEKIDRFCFFVTDQCRRRSSNNTRRTLIESAVHLVKKIFIHIHGELVTQTIPTGRVLRFAFAPSEDLVEFVSGKVELSHDRYLSIGGRVALADLPFAFPHHLYYARWVVLSTIIFSLHISFTFGSIPAICVFSMDFRKKP